MPGPESIAFDDFEFDFHVTKHYKHWYNDAAPSMTQTSCSSDGDKSTGPWSSSVEGLKERVAPTAGVATTARVATTKILENGADNEIIVSTDEKTTKSNGSTSTSTTDKKTKKSNDTEVTLGWIKVVYDYGLMDEHSWNLRLDDWSESFNGKMSVLEYLHVPPQTTIRGWRLDDDVDDSAEEKMSFYHYTRLQNAREITLFVVKVEKRPDNKEAPKVDEEKGKIAQIREYVRGVLIFFVIFTMFEFNRVRRLVFKGEGEDVVPKLLKQEYNKYKRKIAIKDKDAIVKEDDKKKKGENNSGHSSYDQIKNDTSNNPDNRTVGIFFVAVLLFALLSAKLLKSHRRVAANRRRNEIQLADVDLQEKLKP